MARTNPRLFHQQVIHFLRKTVVYGDNGTVFTMGTIPAGSLVLKPASGVHVTTAFNAGTNNFLDIGTSATGDLFATDLSLATATFVPCDEAVGTFLVAADTDITCTVQLSGTAATTGSAEVIVAYIPDTDG